MKKILSAALIAISLISSAFAAPVDNVNSRVKSAFESNYRNTENVKWAVTKDFYKVSFIANKVPTEVFYNLDGEFIGSSHAITLNELPTTVKRKFAKKWGSYTVKEAVQFDSLDETAWFISAENERQTVILKVNNVDISVFKSRNKN